MARTIADVEHIFRKSDHRYVCSLVVGSAAKHPDGEGSDRYYVIVGPPLDYEDVCTETWYKKPDGSIDKSRAPEITRELKWGAIVALLNKKRADRG